MARKIKLPNYIAKERINWQEVVLRTVYNGGLIATAIMAPNALKLFKNIKPNQNSSHLFRAKRSTEKLIALGFLKRSIVKGEHFVEVTNKGQSYLENIYKIKTKKVWDGKWRVVVYDVPEENKINRNKLRRKLQEIGFRLLQSSVWVYPYKSEALVDLKKQMHPWVKRLFI